MIDLKVVAEIRRLFFVLHLTVGAIAENLGIHPKTVRAAINADSFGVKTAHLRASQLDEYLPYIEELLEKYPKITASRLFQILQGRQYEGGLCILRRKLREVRPRPQKAYLRLVFLSGEQAQVDWGLFGSVKVGNANRKLSCFSMVLSYSRFIFVRFTYDQSIESFLRCHLKAFDCFGGVPRKVAYDNLKTAILERVDKAIRYNADHLAFADHFRFEPVACNVRSPYEKGRVERSIQYIRSSFFYARPFSDIEDLNRQALKWMEEVSGQRSWVDDSSKKVRDVFEAEKKTLLPLPDREYIVQHTRVVRSGKTPYVQFDCNYYSIPSELVGKPLTLQAQESHVAIISDQSMVASHVRSYDKGQLIENKEHTENLLERRPKAKINTGKRRLIAINPASEKLIQILAERGFSLGGNISFLLRLVAQYGEKQFSLAVDEALTRDTPQARSIAAILNQMALKEKSLPTIYQEISSDPRVQNQLIESSDLSLYETLTT